jgi:glutathione S-transferase
VKADGTTMMGVWSPEWRLLSDSGPMPGLSLGGQLYVDSKNIVVALDNTYKDSTLTPEQQKKVTDLVLLNYQYQDLLMEAVIHWGWVTFHTKMNDMPPDRFEKFGGNRFGPGKKPLEWEKAKCADISAFFTALETAIDDQALQTGCLVGGTTTMADCANVNWVKSLYDICNLNVAARFPKAWAFYRKQEELSLPKGAQDHHQGFTMFGKFVHMVSFFDRFSCGGAGPHDINAPQLWD